MPSISKLLRWNSAVLISSLFGAISGGVIQALRVTSQPTLFESSAKLMAGGRIFETLPEGDRDRKARDYAWIADNFESSELKQRAFIRLNLQEPHLAACAADIRATQLRGSAVFTIFVTGTDPKCIKLFLDALLDEFIAAEPPPKLSSDFGECYSLYAIIERASPAREVDQDRMLPVLLSVSGGGAFGYLLGLSILFLDGGKVIKTRSPQDISP